MFKILKVVATVILLIDLNAVEQDKIANREKFRKAIVTINSRVRV